MRFVLAALTISGIACICRAAEPKPYWPQDYERIVAKWIEIVPQKNPPKSVSTNLKPPFWDLRWRVYFEKELVVGEAGFNPVENRGAVPPFDPIAQSQEPKAARWVAAPVSDGWLVAFDIGEFGADLVWFNSDGSQRYHVSSDYIQTFLSTPDGLYGQGGLAHMGSNFGSIYALNHENNGRWRSKELCKPQCAHCPIFWADHRLFVLVGKKLFGCDANATLSPLQTKSLPDATKVSLQETSLYAGGQYATTSDKLYLASSWYVTEIDLHTLAKRYLVPDLRFTNEFVEWDVSTSNED